VALPPPAPSRAPRVHGRCRPRRPAVPEALDVERARLTLPGASEPADGTAHRPADLHVWTLHVRYERTGAPEDLAALVEEYTAYALAIAHRMYRRGEPAEDLEQVALESLVAALQRFSVDRGIPFPAFATPTIAGAIKRHYRDRGWTIRAPRQAHDLAGPIRTAREDLGGTLGRAPSTQEVADAVGVEARLVDLVDQAVRARSVASLDTPVHADGQVLGDTVGEDDPQVDRTVDRVALAAALDILTDREREIVVLYYVDEQSQREIAARYGVSQMQVSRWLRLIVGRLRARMAVAV
jgi:RNA polymerase sigma-B factor